MNFHSYSPTCPFSSIEDIKGKHITIMGLGLNGGGEAAVRFFLNKGAFVTVTDMKSAEQLKPTIDKLNNDKNLDTSKLTYRLGEHKIEDFENADCVIKNPGVKYEGNKYLAAAKYIETDLSLFLRFTDCPIIAVTGSKGKSSTVSAIYYGLKESGFNAFLGGNITVSPLTFIDKVNSSTPVVIEFSSWQLSDLRGRNVLKPHISIITKIVPDHQNWYGNMEDYVADKRLIYADQNSQDYSIFDNEDDQPGTGPDSSIHPDSTTWGNLFAKESKATILRYGKSPLNNSYGVWQENHKDGTFEGKIFLPGMKTPETILKNLSVPGEHMKTNVLNAALVLYLMGVEPNKIIDVCSKWPGIEHRLQYFHTWKNKNGTNFTFYNDSCATVPEAAAAATQAFKKPVTLITGGTDKGLELNPLIEVLCAKNNSLKVNQLYFLSGTATDKIIPELKKNKVLFNGPFDNLQSLFENLKTQLNQIKSNDNQIIVFSPGATSFGMFSNEFDRGNKYMTGIKETFN